MIISKNTLIGSVVTDNYKTSEVFTLNRIDFCCGGNRTLEQACLEAKVDLDDLIYTLQKILDNSDQNHLNFDKMELDDLIDYIYNTHHEYVKKQIPILKKYLTKIVHVHVDTHPELHEIHNLFNESADDLLKHMQKEETVLFPYVLDLISKNTFEAKRQVPLNFPISTMKAEHDVEGERFRRINQLTNNYTFPNGACPTFKVTYQLLQEFENNLHHHVHLENNLLFPKAMSLYKNLELT